MSKINEQISIFDMLKIGVGPSSSHTLGPWKAALQWIEYQKLNNRLESIKSISIDLYGSLSYTGKGHATDMAIQLGLSGHLPTTIETNKIDQYIDEISTKNKINLNGEHPIQFNPESDITFHSSFLKYHPNGMTINCFYSNNESDSQTYFSIGGGFVRQENESNLYFQEKSRNFPFPSGTAEELKEICNSNNLSIYEVVLRNERSLRSDEKIEKDISDIWQTMLQSIYDGCHTEGVLPGGLSVKRRAFEIHNKLIKDRPYNNIEEWQETFKKLNVEFHHIFKWISCYALAVNEVNAAFGRIVTAPTNGSAGVIPAVLMYYLSFVNKFAGKDKIQEFLMVAGEIGTLFKKGATISAALGGCQAEIGVSSAMAAGALCSVLGGTNEQILHAAEIAMEHHLGLTCDPINGLVQIPCIERNSMGAIKAINSAELSLETNPEDMKVPLDKVIQSMLKTAKDMNSKYKETSEGGLAVTVNVPEC